MVMVGRPASTQARACWHASRSTQALIGKIRPQASAMGMNCAGGTEPAVGMSPAKQGFRPGDLSRSQIDLRLIVQRELLPFQSASQAFLDRLPLHGAHVHRGREKLIALAPMFLGLVHRGIGILDQRLRIQAVIGIDADADAGGDVKLVLVDRMRLGHRLQHSGSP